MASAAADEAAADEAGAAATAEQGLAPAPVLVEARAQALLIGPLRLALAAGGLAGARLRGVHGGTAAGLFALGAGVLLFAVLASARRRREWARIEAAEPAPRGAATEARWRTLAAATYPSTIGVTALIGVALGKNPALAALLAGVLAGLGLAALAFAAQLSAWERARGARLLVERRRHGRAFVEVSSGRARAGARR
jgi:hypothetical protein